MKYLGTRWWFKFWNGNQAITVERSHPNYATIVAAVKANQLRKALDLFASAPPEAAQARGQQVTFRGRAVPDSIAMAYHTARAADNGSLDGLGKFVDNCLANPDGTVLADLARFMASNRCPITSRGTFLAYKRVESNYKPIHTNGHGFDNHPGNVVSMPRHKVVRDPNTSCAPGLHVCTYTYLPGYGGVSGSDNNRPAIIVEVNPRDVVSVPNDYGGTKMRVCRYLSLCRLRDFVSYFDGARPVNPLGAFGYIDIQALDAVFERDGALAPTRDVTRTDWLATERTIA